jgi:hypothetical protein
VYLAPLARSRLQVPPHVLRALWVPYQRRRMPLHARSAPQEPSPLLQLARCAPCAVWVAMPQGRAPPRALVARQVRTPTHRELARAHLVQSGHSHHLRDQRHVARALLALPARSRVRRRAPSVPPVRFRIPPVQGRVSNAELAPSLLVREAHHVIPVVPAPTAPLEHGHALAAHRGQCLAGKQNTALRVAPALSPQLRVPVAVAHVPLARFSQAAPPWSVLHVLTAQSLGQEPAPAWRVQLVVRRILLKRSVFHVEPADTPLPQDLQRALSVH